ncbi:MAG TPA: hypothetical protein ENN05_03885 [Deltaproteobacteria bacterium]|nr:hypothetical protein [Deltaproteobacteria bacterium]
MSRKGNLDIILKNMDSSRATKILAKTLYKELTNNGFSNKDIINFSKEMLDFMAAEMRKSSPIQAPDKKDRLLIG